MGFWKQWFGRERRKVSEMSLRDLGWYVWTYYRIWIAGIVAALGVIIFLVVRLATVPGENYFFACFPNTYANLGKGSAFYEEFAEYAGYDLKEKNLEFNASIYCKPSAGAGSSYYRSLISFLDSGALDVLVMEQEDIETIGEVGRLLDLEDERMGDFAERWAGRLVYVKPTVEYKKDWVPVGIDIAGSILVDEYNAYPDGAVLGVSAQAGHLDQVEVFLDYIFAEAEA